MTRAKEEKELKKEEVRLMNTSKLAYIGDAVYELLIREKFLFVKTGRMDEQNRMAVKYVKAEAQAYAIKKILPNLPEDEQLLVKRARNHKITSKPQNAKPLTYKLATAFEAYVGYLYLIKDERLYEFLDKAMEIIDNAYERGKIEKRGKHE